MAVGEAALPAGPQVTSEEPTLWRPGCLAALHALSAHSTLSLNTEFLNLRVLGEHPVLSFLEAQTWFHGLVSCLITFKDSLEIHCLSPQIMVKYI